MKGKRTYFNMILLEKGKQKVRNCIQHVPVCQFEDLTFIVDP